MVLTVGTQVVVLRKFSGPDEAEYIPGQLLDTTDWPSRRIQQLVGQRLIRVATREEIDSAEEVIPVGASTPKLKARKASGKKGTR